MREIREAERAIRKVQSEIRDCEAALRDRDKGARMDSDVRRRTFDSRPEAAKSGLAVLQGEWVSLGGGDEVLQIKGNTIVVRIRDRSGYRVVEGKVLIDEDKGHFDYTLNDGTVYRHLYEVEKLQNGKTMLSTQYDPRDRTKRPVEKELDAETYLGYNGQCYVLRQ